MNKLCFISNFKLSFECIEKSEYPITSSPICTADKYFNGTDYRRYFEKIIMEEKTFW